MKQLYDVAQIVRINWVFNHIELNQHVDICKFLRNEDVSGIFPLGLGKEFYEGTTLDNFYSQMLTDILIIFPNKKRNGKTNDKIISLS
jgi:hypothetical protein